MKTTEKALLALVAGAGAAYGLKTYLRSQRRISLAGKSVIVTGSTSGLGLLLAKEAAKQGARVVLAARDEHDLERAAADVRRLGAPDVLAVPTDVSDADQAQALIDKTIERFGGVDVLLNDAGLMIVGPAAAMTLEDYRKVLGTNFWGAVNTSLAVIPHMRARRSGRIGNIVSIGGLIPAPHMLPYTASKFALTGFTRGLRNDLARDNVLVTGIYPPTIRTGGHPHAWFKGDKEREYTWFGLGDTIPGVAKSAEATAKQAWRAICDGDPELIVGLPAKLAVAFDGVFPEWSSELRALVERGLPAPIHLDAPATQGKDLQGKVAGMLNSLIPAGTRAGGASHAS